MTFLSGGGSGVTSSDQLRETAMNIISWSAPPEVDGGGTAPTAGTIYASPIGLTVATTITNLIAWPNTAGVGTAPTLIRLGLMSNTGTVLALTANVASAGGWLATNFVPIALTSPYLVPSTGGYYILFIQTGAFGTTQMALQARVFTSLTVIRIGTGAVIGATFGTAQSDLPGVGSSVPTGATANGTCFWFAAN